MPHGSMDVYLDDHLSGAAAGMRLVELAAERHHSGELSEFFASLAAEIKADSPYETSTSGGPVDVRMKHGTLHSPPWTVPVVASGR